MGAQNNKINIHHNIHFLEESILHDVDSIDAILDLSDFSNDKEHTLYDILLYLQDRYHWYYTILSNHKNNIKIAFLLLYKSMYYLEYYNNSINIDMLGYNA